MRGWNLSREVAVVPVAGVLPAFVALWIASPASQDWLSGVARGATYTGINIEDLRRLPVAIPPITEQQEVVRRVESLFELAAAIENRVEEAAARADNLTQAILAKAFRGELLSPQHFSEAAT
jgi:type I restriction enzyme S subunit